MIQKCSQCKKCVFYDHFIDSVFLYCFFLKWFFYNRHSAISSTFYYFCLLSYFLLRWFPTAQPIDKFRNESNLSINRNSHHVFNVVWMNDVFFSSIIITTRCPYGEKFSFYKNQTESQQKSHTHTHTAVREIWIDNVHKIERVFDSWPNRNKPSKITTTRKK